MSDFPELLPCPFCGAPAELFHNTSSDYEYNWYWLHRVDELSEYCK